MKLRNYISCFGPQFVHGLAVLADKVDYRPTTFFKRALALPDFHKLGAEPEPRDARAGDLHAVVWMTIACSWVVLLAMLFVLGFNLSQWLALVFFVSFIAPFVLIFIGFLILVLHRSFPD